MSKKRETTSKEDVKWNMGKYFLLRSRPSNILKNFKQCRCMTASFIKVRLYVGLKPQGRSVLEWQ